MDHYHDVGINWSLYVEITMKHYRFPSVRIDGLTLILGLGETGVAAANWCLAQGATLRVADTRAKSTQAQALFAKHPDSVQLRLGVNALTANVLEGVHTVVLSPGLSPLQDGVHELLSLAQQQGISIINEIELFALALGDLKEREAYAPKVFAVTGTNGKTTVTALTRHMLESSGLKVAAAGNISPAALHALSAAIASDQLPDAWVIELSSFQLHSLQSLQADVACVLNISQDHLDWHGSFEAYQTAKAKVLKQAQYKVISRDDLATAAMVESLSAMNVRSFGSEKPTWAGDVGVELEQGVAWISAAEEVDKRTVRLGLSAKQAVFAAARVPATTERLLPVDALRIRGQHNVLNALAALAMCRSAGFDWEPLLYALRDYGGEPHRTEYVRSVRGVSFVNDSKGTNVGATVAALTGLEQRVVLIVGGLGKGQNFEPLVQAINQAKVVAIVLMGAAASELRATLSVTVVPQFDAKNMAEAVRIAYAQATEGDMVLLSPACASMDMFESYVHRGNAYVSEVTELALELGEMA